MSHRKVEKGVLIMRETLCKSSVKFVRHVPMMYVNLIVIVSVVSEKKNRRH